LTFLCDYIKIYLINETFLVFNKIIISNASHKCFISCPIGQSFDERIFHWSFLKKSAEAQGSSEKEDV